MNISIALATYNGASYLQAQLDSFITQTRLPDELVATDDGSTDSTVDILESFAATAPFKVIVQRNERNYGYGSNFNQALLKTSGDLVFLSDQDDVWFPDKIERIVTIAALDRRSLVFMNDAALTNAKLQDTGLTKIGQIRSAGLTESSFVMGCCAAVKRDLLDLCLPIPDGFAHDSWIVPIAEGMGRKRIVPEVLQYYRRHGKNESQYIVNRTTRVTRWSIRAELWRGRFSQLFGLGESPLMPSKPDVPYQVFMRKWAEEASAKTSDPFVSELLTFADHLLLVEHAQVRREEIRRQDLLLRVRDVFTFWRSGGYAPFSGWESALRDLVGL